LGIRRDCDGGRNAIIASLALARATTALSVASLWRDRQRAAAITAGTMVLDGGLSIRVAAQIYDEIGDYQRLAVVGTVSGRSALGAGYRAEWAVATPDGADDGEALVIADFVVDLRRHADRQPAVEHHGFRRDGGSALPIAP